MLQIQAVPRFRTIGVGETITFRLVSTELTELLMPGTDDKRTLWGVAQIADNGDQKVLQFSDAGMQGQGIGFEFSFTFDRVGKFTIFGGVSLPMGDKRFNSDGSWLSIVGAEYHQNVQPTDSFMWDPVNKQLTHVQDPRSAVMAVNRYLSVLQSVATPLYLRLDQPAMVLRQQHEAFFKKMQQSAAALDNRLQSTQTWVRIPVDAIHRDNSTGQISELKLFLAHPVSQGSPAQWKLVDWSHPGDTRLDGEYDGSGPNDHDAALAALTAFENGNQYPPGAITITIAAHVITADPFVKGFFTTGRSFWGTVSDFLASAALWVGLLAVVLTIAPIPGSQVAAAALWLGIFSGAAGAAAAGLSLYERHARNVADASQDALDALTIVACVAGGAGVWARHATVALRLPGAVREFVLVGAVASDSLQGVLIAKDAVTGTENAVDAIFRISKDDTLTPADKVEKLLKVIGGLVVTGVIIYASAKATAGNMARVNESLPPGPKPSQPSGSGGTPPKGPPSRNLTDIVDPAKTVDLTGEPKQTGNTTDGSHTTVVEHAPERASVGPTGASTAVGTTLLPKYIPGAKYLIGEGVRRAVAARECGNPTITARIIDPVTQKLSDPVQIPLDGLVVEPKKATIPRDSRYINVFMDTGRGQIRDPIEVRQMDPAHNSPTVPLLDVRLTRAR